MNKLIKVLMFGILPIGQVFASEDTRLYCPRQIECSIKNPYYANIECHLSDNPYKMWLEPLISYNSKPNDREVKPGKYPLKEVFLGINSYSLSKTYCVYSNGNISFSIPIVQNTPNKFEPLINDSYKWIKNDNNSFNCDANENSSQCPMVEKPEIVITDNLSFYIPDYNAEPGDNYKTFSRLTYNQLVTICGRTSNCIVDIGDRYYNSSEINHLGSVDVDISIPNKVKINNIFTDSWWSHKLLKKEPFNTIILH
ncbi:MAG: hypothetical protein EBQ95_08325 [Gammaproteobacteria bacterium]|nr:hypothetical protein [Gammaproteobacteria bacterium]